jgi:hypothetical protein
VLRCCSASLRLQFHYDSDLARQFSTADNMRLDITTVRQERPWISDVCQLCGKSARRQLIFSDDLNDPLALCVGCAENILETIRLEFHEIIVFEEGTKP